MAIEELKQRVEEKYLLIKRIREQIGNVLVGQSKLVDGLLIGLFCKNHVLIEGVPGLGDQGEPAADVGLPLCYADAQVLQALVFLGDPFAAEADDCGGQDPQGAYR